MNNVERSLIDYHKDILNMKKTLFGSLSSQNIEIQQITSAKYTVLMLSVGQNGRKKAFGRSRPYQE